MKTNYEKEYQSFKEWWDKLTFKSDKWTTLERLAAHDAWMEAKGVFKTEKNKITDKEYKNLMRVIKPI